MAKPSPISTTVFPILLGIAAVLGVFALLRDQETGRDEFGMGPAPNQPWAYLWVGIGAAIIAIAIILAIRHARKKHAKNR